MAIRILFLSFLFLFVGCTKSSDSVPVRQKTDEEIRKERLDKARLRNCNAGSVGVGIIGGEKLSSDSRVAKSTVLIYSEAGDGQFFSCTGTVISKYMVLTAAHCFQSEKMKVKVYFSTDPVCQYAKNELFEVPVRRINRHEEYKAMDAANLAQKNGESDQHYATPEMAKYDVALLELERAIPWPYQPIKISDSNSDTLDSSSLFVAAGFGVTTGFRQNDDLDPMLRFATLSMKKELSRKESDLLIRSGLMPAEITHFYFSDQVKKSGICSGDSGGPLFRSNGFSLEQVGVASYVFDANMQADPCAYSGVHVKIDTLRGWLKRVFSESSTGENNPF